MSPDAGSPRAERRSGEQARWRQVLEVAPEAYVAVRADGRIADWNRRAEILFGWSRREAVGQPAGILSADRTMDLASGALAQPAEPFDLLAADRQGRLFTAQCTAWGVDRRGSTTAHVFLVDVTERRRAERASALLTAVVEGSTDAMVTTDPDGRILSWNAGAEQMCGWTAREAVGAPDALYVPADRAAVTAELQRRLRSGDVVAPVETEWLTRGGTRVPVALTLSPVHDDQGRVVATSATARDITEQRWMAETLDDTLRRLQAAALEARASEAVSRTFLADAAHQLRTPVAGIRACAETLLRGPPSGDAERLLAMMVRESIRAGDLIAALLRIARLDQGVPLATERVDLVALCAEEVERLGLLRPELTVALEVVPPAPPGPVCLDAAAVREVLGNLGDNAVRHAVGRVLVRVEAAGEQVGVRVLDDGPGVPEGDREAVFQRFVSLDGRGGSGLGLPIARGLARAMGGDLLCDGGFLLTLPGPPSPEPVAAEPDGR